MRVDASVLGPLACLIGNVVAHTLGGGVSSTSMPTTTTTSTTEGGTSGATATPVYLDSNVWAVKENVQYPIFYPDAAQLPSPSPKVITWTPGEGAQVNKVYLRNETGDDIGSGEPSTPSSPTSSDAGSGEGGHSKRDVTDGKSGNSPVTLKVDSNSVSIPLGALQINYWRETENLGKPLYLEFQWESKQANLKGIYYSPAMGLVGTEADASQMWGELDAASQYPDQFTSAPTLPISTTAPEATGSSITTSVSTTQGSSTASAGSDSNAAGGGLSTGAIAGIAVACGVVGLALIGLGIWFCLRRRRSSDKVRDVNYGSDAGNNVMMAEKDMPGITESSPHSTYADDGGRLHDRHPVAMPHEQAGFVPYSDGAPAAGALQRSQSDLPLQSEASNSRNRSPSPAVTSRYAHLVEEGMTEDEIRRLEEEERQLDAAIQEAGERRSAKPSS